MQHFSHIHWLLFTKRGKITPADNGMILLHFGRDLVDTRIRINPDMRI